MSCNCKANKLNKIINNNNNTNNYEKKGTKFIIRNIIDNLSNFFGKLLICLIVILLMPFIIIYTVLSLIFKESLGMKIPKGLKNKLKEIS